MTYFISSGLYISGCHPRVKVKLHYSYGKEAQNSEYSGSELSNAGGEKAVLRSPQGTFISLEDSTVLRFRGLSSTIALPEGLFSELIEETTFPRKALAEQIIPRIGIMYYYKAYEAVK